MDDVTMEWLGWDGAGDPCWKSTLAEDYNRVPAGVLREFCRLVTCGGKPLIATHENKRGVQVVDLGLIEREP